MLRNWRRVSICLIAGCLWMLWGCSDSHEEQDELTEVEELQESSEETESDEESNIYVYICGQVQNPGVYELRAGSRVYEAVEAAGGMTESAADTYLNQAQKLEDGQQIQVLSKEEAERESSSEGSQGSQGPDDGKVNLNTASREELMTLNGIGEAKAEAILRYREEKGKFQSVEEVKQVEGIKDGVYHKIKEQIKI